MSDITNQPDLPGSESWEVSTVDHQHEWLVDKLFKKPTSSELLLLESQYELLHAAIGIATEAGEILDVVKKHIIYNRPLDYQHLQEELGDLEFYLRALYLRLGISRKEVLTQNMEKLRIRYPNIKYTDKDAIERKDKA